MTYKQKKIYYLYLKSEEPKEFLYVMKWLLIGIGLLSAGIYPLLFLSDLFKSQLVMKIVAVSIPLVAAALQHLFIHIYTSIETPRMQHYTRLQRYKIKRAIKLQKKSIPMFYLYSVLVTVVMTYLVFLK